VDKIARSALRFLVAAALVAIITTVYFKGIQAANTTVALTYLLAVLVISTVWGLIYAAFAAVAATVAFNYFFLPPIGSFEIADSQNWVALFVFLATALIASQLSERARREAVISDRRRHEVERLYSFSQQLLLRENVLELLNIIPDQVVQTFGATAAVLLLASNQKLYYSDLAAQSLVDAEELKLVLARGTPKVDNEQGVHYLPLRMGMRFVGGIAVAGGSISRETLEALASLVAVAIERATASDKLNKSEAARQSEKLRTALLDSVTHDFRTPLTGIKGSVTTLLSGVSLDESQRQELLTIIDEGSDRLNRLIGEAVEMAQLDAGHVHLHLEPHEIAEAVDIALAECKAELERHCLDVQLSPDLPPARMDAERIAEVLAHFLTNASKYSPPGTTIHIRSEVAGNLLKTSVADHGPGIDDLEQSLIFEKFYRGRGQRSAIQGTGMGLAIAKAIVDAHGGNIGVTSQLGRGSVFYFDLPLA
jgi:two-component system sensor histidine kinase KdpD